MADVFISYHVASAKAVVRQIAEQLRKRGITYWYSETGVYGGEDFARIVPPEIDACKVFLLVLDKGAANSFHVETELGLAVERIHEITIIPFRIQKFTKNDWMRYYLKHIQIMDGQNPPQNKRIEELANRIEEVLGKEEQSAKNKVQEPEHTRLRIWKALFLMIVSLSLFFAGYIFYQQQATMQSETNVTNPQEVEGEAEISIGKEPLILLNGTQGLSIEEVMPVQYIHETLSAGYLHTVGLRTDGTVVAVGWNGHSQCDITDWRDITAVSAGDWYTVGLRKDGAVAAAGSNTNGQCDVSDWRDIAMVSAGGGHTVGLRKDGMVVAVGANSHGQCDITDWRDITAVSAGEMQTLGLREDGTVVAVGWNDYGQCDVSDWTDIAAVSAGHDHTVGLRKDGTVVAVGRNDSGQCEVSDWRNIEMVFTGWYHTIGLRTDGTVVATGWNDYGQCNVSDWWDIVAVSAGEKHTIGLRKDGTVVAVGDNSDGQCNVSDWTDIRLP